MATYQRGIPAREPGSEYSKWLHLKLNTISSKELNIKKGPHVARYDFINNGWVLRYYKGGRRIIYLSEVEGWKTLPKKKPKPVEPKL